MYIECCSVLCLSEVFTGEERRGGVDLTTQGQSSQMEVPVKGIPIQH